ncbi:MAG: AI-2E family transporter [Acidimicrobiales bacterium]
MAERPALRVPGWMRTGSEIAVRTAVLAAGLLALAWLFLHLRVVTIPAFVALLGATVLMPPVAALRRRGWPPLLATWTVVLGAIIVVAGAIALLVPAFVDQIGELGDQLDEAIAEIEDWLVTGPVGIDDPDLRSAFNTLGERVVEADPAAVLDGATLAAEIIAGILLAVVMLFFFVKDGPLIVHWARGHLPADRREDAARAGRAAWNALGAYVRGTLVVGAVNGTVIGVGLAILGVPLALPLGIITALSAFFPLIGAVVAGTLAALIALVSGGVFTALIVVGLTVAVQQIEGDVVSPIVMGRALRLHPLVVLVALSIGAITAGLLGAFLAIPLTGVSVAVSGALRHDERHDEAV